ncbi:EAL domain-containing protein [Paenibacillus sp. TRM 82003]|uniref:putative bifunctional diguanylate cyclase/phosphodiesterase n=1 Tax=Kineococcus sp. TRM81007 TaxID=2925831 RepID=UPI001F57E6E4|nr:EAL domain-containing protein [Kineococcus sp. TRM81007]MCI2237312.1 EAL domain-containing protein [Kineococcus sp. TRM81007]MCI3926581.1 EAL domain-containing protein [Paenibacillus sp. TRM 82003]
MSDLLIGGAEAPALGALASPVTVIEAGTTCRDVDELFRADEHLGCLAVHGGAPHRRLGLVSRARFQHLMSGRLGYGRLLNARRPVSELTDWSPLVVHADTGVAEVARQVLDRSWSQRFSEVLVRDPGAPLRQVSVTDVFRALSGELANKALTDALTGLANREHFMQRLEQCCAEPDVQHRLALVYVDLDGFKALNDGHGHGVGDQVLQVVADRLRGCFRSDDLVARLGGDEFAAIAQLPAGVPVAPAARHLGERVRACLSGTISLGPLVLPGRASIGMAVAGSVLADGEVLLREADSAMYRAKAVGGGRVELITSVGTTAPQENFTPDRRELQRAVDGGEFLVHYQPIVEASTGRLASVEALVRWQHPRRGLLAPGAFLEAVTDAGFAANLDLHVLEVALAQFSRWRHGLGRAAPRAVNVNVSVQGLLHPGLAPTVLDALSRAGLDPAVLRVELPEAATTAQLDVAGGALETLRDAGVRLTLDDLGAGASTLHHLTGLTLDGVKIDRRFVAGLLDDERDAAVVAMLLELAHTTGIAVTAEGVENRSQLEALQRMARGRPTFVQGYLISRPVAAEQLALPWSDGLHHLHPQVPAPRSAAPAAPGPLASR